MSALELLELAHLLFRHVLLVLAPLLLVNLVWSAWLLVGFLRGRVGFSALERWQTRYLPVFGIWAALVVVVLPPIFGFN